MADTLFWYDFETFGADTVWDRPAQFAGIRTDLDLNIVGEPEMFYCRQADDYLPHPMACLITGISPQTCQQEGLPEAEFIARIHELFSEPGTCVAGYNSIRFDDEVTRNTLYRNFYDPYQREWQNGNSRWDILDMMRCAYALRPEGIVWPWVNQAGELVAKQAGSQTPEFSAGESADTAKVSFKLELLTKVNGIEHENAHDAMSDVYATIAIAKLVKEKQPRLFDYLFNLRRKDAVSAQLDVVNKRPVLHISGMFPVQNGCAAVMVPLAWDAQNKNAVICYDLMADPKPLFELSVEQIQQRLFTPTAEMPEGMTRLPLKSIHINKCPVVAPAKMVTPDVAERWGFDGERMRQHLQQIRSGGDLTDKLHQVMARPQKAGSADPDGMIYSGGFFGPSDKQFMARIREADPYTLGEMECGFQDRRLEEMLFRYRARNYPDSLSGDEHERWEQFRMQRLMDSNSPVLTFEKFAQVFNELYQNADERQQLVLEDLKLYAESIYPY